MSERGIGFNTSFSYPVLKLRLMVFIFPMPTFSSGNIYYFHLQNPDFFHSLIQGFCLYRPNCRKQFLLSQFHDDWYWSHVIHPFLSHPPCQPYYCPLRVKLLCDWSEFVGTFTYAGYHPKLLNFHELVKDRNR